MKYHCPNCEKVWETGEAIERGLCLCSYPGHEVVKEEGGMVTMKPKKPKKPKGY